MKKKYIDFYLNIPIMTSFSQVFDENNYAQPPNDWCVIVTDVVNSTKAIEGGKYKDVNVAGALPAMAITNYIGHMQFPFIFGGDGMLYIIPGEFSVRVRDILADSRNLVRNIFGLELRVGMVMVSEIISSGHTLQIARLQVSERYIQAIVDGDGAEYAEQLIKSPETTDKYQIPRNHRIRARADFSGFTCRWKPVKSPKDETISVIVKPQGGAGDTSTDLMRGVFTNISKIFGSPEMYRPVTSTNQQLGLSKKYLHTEASVLSRHSRGFFYRLRLYMVRLHSLMLVLMNFRLKSISANNSISSDFRKFDGTLKMVISCTSEERKRLDKFLNDLHSSGKIFYGIHVSDRALLTCLIQQGEDEVHFVDADDGGYAIAAKQLKRQIADVA